MRLIIFLILGFFILLFSSFERVEKSPSFHPQFLKYKAIPVEKNKEKKSEKIQKKKNILGKNTDKYIPVEPIVGILSWTLIITGAVLFFVGFFQIFSPIVWIVGLCILGFANLFALISSIFIYKSYYEVAEALAQLVSNFVTMGLEFIFGLIFLIWGIIISIPLLWITGIILIACIGIFILIIALFMSQD